MRLARRDIGLVELDRRICESGLDIAALTLQSLLRAERGGNHVSVLVRFKMSLDIRLVLGVCDTNRIGSGFGGLECVRYGERDILPVIANDIVLKRRTALFTDAFKSGPQGR